MSLPNIRQYINAVINPKIRALALVYENHVRYMQQVMDLQTKLFYESQEQITDLTKQVLKLQGQVIEYQKETVNLKKNSFSYDQVRQMLRRIQELNYISSILYQKYVELAGEEGWNPADLPSFNSPWIPGDYVKTEAEVEQEWRERNNLTPDQELTDLEKNQLKAYIAEYYRTHWSTSEPVPPTE